MSIFSFADLSAAYPTFYSGDVRPQMQRKAPLLRYLPVKQCATGDKARWLTSFDGQTAGNVNIDGGNFITAAADPRVPAELAFGAVSAPVKVTTAAQWKGSAQSVQSNLFDLIGQNLMEALNKAVKLMNQQLFNGTGPAAGNQLTSLSSAIATTGTYANIAQGTYSNWASQRKGNSGSLRSLSLSLVKQTTSAIAAVSPYGRPDFAVLGSTLFDVLEGLFDGTLYTQAGRNDLMFGQVMTNGGKIIQSTGFRTLYWASQGITFIEDPDCTNTAETNANNIIYFLNSNAVEIQYLQPTSMGQYVADQKSIQAAEQQLGGLAGLLFDWRMRPRTQYSDEGDITCALNLVVKDRAACGLLSDVQ
jgi:hypothetical protein